jgi:pimeloyl-ACP methyl ester carboxylesterase
MTGRPRLVLSLWLLSPHHRVIALDVRGHGRSAKPRAAASYGRELAADVVRLLDREGAAKAHVVSSPTRRWS